VLKGPFWCADIKGQEHLGVRVPGREIYYAKEGMEKWRKQGDRSNFDRRSFGKGKATGKGLFELEKKLSSGRDIWFEGA